MSATELTELTEETEEADDRTVTFTDVRRACHRWLMERDPHYRKSNETFMNALNERKARKNRQSNNPTR